MQIAIASRTRAVSPDRQSQGQTLRIVPVLGPSHDHPSELCGGRALAMAGRIRGMVTTP